MKLSVKQAGAMLVMLVAWAAPLSAQEMPPAVAAKDLKERPQKYWASFFVFSDVLKEKPARSLRTIDGIKVARFEAEALGEAFVEEAALPVLRDLPDGEEYLFFATVTQSKGSSWKLWSSGREFVVVVKDVARIQRAPDEIPSRLVWSGDAGVTNRMNLPLIWLDQIIKEVHKDIYGFAQAQGVPMADAFTRDEHQEKVAASVRSALRRFEEQNRITSQEFFVQIVRSLIAYQYGYVDAASAGYTPEAPLEEPALAAPVEEVEVVPAPEVVEAEPVAGEDVVEAMIEEDTQAEPVVVLEEVAAEAPVEVDAVEAVAGQVLPEDVTPPAGESPLPATTINPYAKPLPR